MAKLTRKKLVRAIETHGVVMRLPKLLDQQPARAILFFKNGEQCGNVLLQHLLKQGWLAASPTGRPPAPNIARVELIHHDREAAIVAAKKEFGILRIDKFEERDWLLEIL